MDMVGHSVISDARCYVVGIRYYVVGIYSAIRFISIVIVFSVISGEPEWLVTSRDVVGYSVTTTILNYMVGYSVINDAINDMAMGAEF